MLYLKHIICAIPIVLSNINVPHKFRIVIIESLLVLNEYFCENLSFHQKKQNKI